MGRLLALAFAAFLSTGCAARSATIESPVPTQESTLSGSPCLDGLFVNLEERCLMPVASDSPYGDYVIVGCDIPLVPQPDDLLYEGYTQLTFRVYNNELLPFIEIDESEVAYFCQDTVVTVGFEIPTE